ncbi:MAG: TetR/AcrR family transcriptional regulator [Desulfobacteraceae bacterium]|nr:TetR/AcrR family transcriptional regulator [Desulfobacteraceae bacterium]
MKKTTKNNWFAEGFKILRSTGAAGLTIENLTRGLNKTKGSFYHHFKNRKDYSRQLLEQWEESQAIEIIQSSKQRKTLEGINESLVNLSEKAMDPKTEVAIRAWALRDPLARKFQERIDSQRMDFLRNMFSLMTDDKDKAELFSLIRYCFYIGSHQIIPAMDEKIYGQNLAALMEMFEQYIQTDNTITTKKGPTHENHY